MPNPPKPTALKILQGNPGKRPLNMDEPKYEILKINAPDNLSPAAADHWGAICDMLTDAGVFTVADVDALSIYCEAYARWAEANAKIQELGMLVKSPNGYPMPSPYLSISNKAFEQMKGLLVEFGMTPSSRTRLKAEKQEAKKGRFDDV